MKLSLLTVRAPSQVGYIFPIEVEIRHRTAGHYRDAGLSNFACEQLSLNGGLISFILNKRRVSVDVDADPPFKVFYPTKKLALRLRGPPVVLNVPLLWPCGLSRSVPSAFPARSLWQHNAQ